MPNEKLQSAADDLYAWFMKSVSRNRPAEQAAQVALNKEAVQLIGWRHLINAQLSNYDDPIGDGWVSFDTLFDLLLSLGLSYAQGTNQEDTEHWHVLWVDKSLSFNYRFNDTNGGNAVPDLSRPINLTRFMLDLQALVDTKVTARMNALWEEYVPTHGLRLLRDGYEIGKMIEDTYNLTLNLSYSVFDPLFCYWQACVRTEIILQMPARERLTMLGYDCTLPSNESTESEDDKNA